MPPLTPLQKNIATSLGIALFVSLLEMAGTPLFQTIVTKDHHPNPDNQREMFLMQLAGGAATLPINAFFIAIAQAYNQRNNDNCVPVMLRMTSFCLAAYSAVFTTMYQATIGKEILDSLSQELDVKLLGTYQHSGSQSESDNIQTINECGMLGSLMILGGMAYVGQFLRGCREYAIDAQPHAQRHAQRHAQPHAQRHAQRHAQPHAQPVDEGNNGVEMVQPGAADDINHEVSHLSPPNDHGPTAGSLTIVSSTTRYKLDCGGSTLTHEDSALNNMV